MSLFKSANADDDLLGGLVIPSGIPGGGGARRAVGAAARAIMKVAKTRPTEVNRKTYNAKILYRIKGFPNDGTISVTGTPVELAMKARAMKDEGYTHLEIRFRGRRIIV